MCGEKFQATCETGTQRANKEENIGHTGGWHGVRSCLHRALTRYCLRCHEEPNSDTPYVHGSRDEEGHAALRRISRFHCGGEMFIFFVCFFSL